MDEKKIYSLSTILKGIREYLEVRTKGKYFWLRVELANINLHSSGHCYLELVETRNDISIAQCKGTIWKSSLNEIKTKLGDDFSNIIKKGNELLCNVEIQFTEQYGLCVNIKDIDVSFNLGALEKKKQETIDRLKKENLLDRNKLHKLPLVIQKIAIIGSPETSGILDLQKQLDKNSYNYHFDYKIYPCLVQGEKAESEIIQRLKQLNDSNCDMIALIRGGGSKLDLDVFNSYNIAKEIAFLNKPVFTGIGHETDISVADLVANIYHKTPTALGSFIVERAHNFETRVINIFTGVIEYKNRFLADKKNHLKLNIQTLSSKSVSITRLRRGDLHSNMNRIIAEFKSHLNNEKNKILVGYELIKSNPKSTLQLRRGTLNSNMNRIVADVRQHLNKEKNNISYGLELIKTSPFNYLTNSRNNLRHTMELMQINSEGKIKLSIDNFKNTMELIFSYSKQKIDDRLNYTNNVFGVVSLYHPDNILTKGYAIPRIEGKLLVDQSIDENTELEIELYKRILIVSYKKDKQRWKTSIMSKLLRS